MCRCNIDNAAKLPGPGWSCGATTRTGRRSRAPSQNVVIAACDGSLAPQRLRATESYGHFLAVNGDLDGRTLLAVEGRHLYYREVKEFAERVRLAVEDRIRDPAIVNGRTPVALYPSHVTD